MKKGKYKSYLSLYDFKKNKAKDIPYDLSTIKTKHSLNECYLCGVLLDKNNSSKDHIPSQCLFYGFPNKYKINRITVPCCKKCNIELSKYENEFRNLIGVTANKNKRLKPICVKSVRELLRNNNLSRLLISCDNKICGIEFSNIPILKSIDKNFKGVFYKINGFRLPNYFQLYYLSQLDVPQDLNIDNCLYSSKWYYSGNENIFKIKIVFLNTKMEKTLSINNTSFIISKLVFHKNYIYYVIANRIQ